MLPALLAFLANQHSLFLRCLTVVADHAGDLSLSVVVLPQQDEFRYSDVVGLPGMVEAMDADTHCRVMDELVREMMLLRADIQPLPPLPPFFAV